MKPPTTTGVLLGLVLLLLAAASTALVYKLNSQQAETKSTILEEE